MAGCSSYVVSGWIVSGSDTMLTAPSNLINLLAEKFELNVLLLPVPLPNIKIVQVWHERNHQDPGHQWFRGMVRDVLHSR